MKPSTAFRGALPAFHSASARRQRSSGSRKPMFKAADTRACQSHGSPLRMKSW